LRTTT